MSFPSIAELKQLSDSERVTDPKLIVLRAVNLLAGRTFAFFSIRLHERTFPHPPSVPDFGDLRKAGLP